MGAGLPDRARACSVGGDAVGEGGASQTKLMVARKAVAIGFSSSVPNHLHESLRPSHFITERLCLRSPSRHNHTPPATITSSSRQRERDCSRLSHAPPAQLGLPQVERLRQSKGVGNRASSTVHALSPHHSRPSPLSHHSPLSIDPHMSIPHLTGTLGPSHRQQRRLVTGRPPQTRLHHHEHTFTGPRNHQKAV